MAESGVQQAPAPDDADDVDDADDADTLCVLCNAHAPPNCKHREPTWSQCTECAHWAHDVCIRRQPGRVRPADWKCADCAAEHARGGR